MSMFSIIFTEFDQCIDMALIFKWGKQNLSNQVAIKIKPLKGKFRKPHKLQQIYKEHGRYLGIPEYQTIVF